MQVDITQEMINAVRAFVPAPCSVVQAKRAAEALLALVSDCRACPEDCGECSKGWECCECYTHQELHPHTRAVDAIQALYDQARGGRVTEASVRRIARHFGFEEPR